MAFPNNCPDEIKRDGELRTFFINDHNWHNSQHKLPKHLLVRINNQEHRTDNPIMLASWLEPGRNGEIVGIAPEIPLVKKEAAS